MPNQVLVEGRRVQIADLVEAELLKAGDELTFAAHGQTHRSSVTDQGRLRTEDNREFKTPSRAAQEVAKGSPRAGWTCWFTSDGESLDSLRRQFLSQATIVEVDDDGDIETREVVPAPSRSSTRRAWLTSVRESVDRGESVRSTVRELISHWGQARRGASAVARITADLANYGLTTSPDFLAVNLDAAVSVVSSERVEAVDIAPAEVDGPPAEQREGGPQSNGLTLAHLISPERKLVVVVTNESLEVAITRLRLNGYSQLPVVDQLGRLVGAVTWESIALATAAKDVASLGDATVTAVHHEQQRSLLDVIDEIARLNFVITMDEAGSPVGIVTAADVAEIYHGLSTPFLVIGDLDRMLRALIEESLPLDQIIRLTDKYKPGKVKTVDDLDFGDYCNVLGNKELWPSLNWPVDRREFGKRLEEIRLIRNDVMHFNPDPIPDDTVELLRHVVRLVEDLQGL